MQGIIHPHVSLPNSLPQYVCFPTAYRVGSATQSPETKEKPVPGNQEVFDHRSSFHIVTRSAGLTGHVFRRRKAFVLTEQSLTLVG
jgi:hypothetical protein